MECGIVGRTGPPVVPHVVAAPDREAGHVTTRRPLVDVLTVAAVRTKNKTVMVTFVQQMI